MGLLLVLRCALAAGQVSPRQISALGRNDEERVRETRLSCSEQVGQVAGDEDHHGFQDCRIMHGRNAVLPFSPKNLRREAQMVKLNVAYQADLS